LAYDDNNEGKANGLLLPHLGPSYPEDIGLLPIGGEYPVGQIGGSQVLAIGRPSSPETHRALGVHIEAILVNLVQLTQINSQFAPLHVNPTFKCAIVGLGSSDASASDFIAGDRDWEDSELAPAVSAAEIKEAVWRRET
jgi:hypothetical protein